MRPLIQYDLGESPTVPAQNYRPPTKKRKRGHRGPARTSQAVPASAWEASLRHWDDPGSSAVGVIYDEQEGVNMVEEECEEYGEDVTVEGGEDVEQGEEEEESRELTHAEIWDDSALVDAWNSAEAEYEAYHGTSKAWKTEPVKRSPLWYNKPYSAALPPQPGPSKPQAHSKLTVGDEPEYEADTAPLNFDTYIPTHDPSLGLPSATDAKSVPTAPSAFVPPPSTVMVSRDEAFNNALSAMYWGGYWTAVYHCQSQSTGQHNDATTGAIVDSGIEADEDVDEDEDGEDLVPAQR